MKNPKPKCSCGRLLEDDFEELEIGICLECRLEEEDFQRQYDDDDDYYYDNDYFDYEQEY